MKKPHNENVAVPIIERALDLGVNYMILRPSTAAQSDGVEQYVGKVMKHRRSKPSRH